MGGGCPVFILPVSCQTHSLSLLPASRALQPVGSVAAAHSLTSQQQCSRKTKTPGCKHLCETNASSSKRFPPITLLTASAPRQHYFFIQSRKHTISKQSTSYTVFFHSDQRAIYFVLLPCPCTLQSTSVASLKRFHAQNTG